MTAVGRIRRRRALMLGALVLLGIVLLPSAAWAWAPGTHIFLGESVLSALAQLPSSVADLLRAFPYDFLYGNIAADTSIAKKYAPAGRHCHSWAVGLEIFERAPEGPLRAFGLGYLVAPRRRRRGAQFLRAAPSRARVAHVGRSATATGRAGSRRTSAAATAGARAMSSCSTIRAPTTHLDRILSPTIFSTQTNRRIFRGMVHVTDSESLAADLPARRRREPVGPERSGGRALPGAVVRLRDGFPEPRGALGAVHARSRRATWRCAARSKCARGARASGMEFRVAEEAVREFAMPDSALAFASGLPSPLYAPVREARSDSN